MLTETLKPADAPHDDGALVSLFEAIALEAGAAIMDVREKGCAVEEKADASPVTLADRAAEAIILKHLAKELGATPCVSEEAASGGVIPACGEDGFLLVDPLDGTREFINQRPDFTVNIALVRKGVPEVGVVYAPARQTLWSGRPGSAEKVKIEDGRIISREAIQVREAPNPPVIVASRSHLTPETEAFIARYPGATTVSVGSSLKFCLIAEGEADLYPRFGPTMQWDTAAGDAVLRAAGGRTTHEDGSLLTYGPKKGDGLEQFASPNFIAEGRLTKA